MEQTAKQNTAEDYARIEDGVKAQMEKIEAMEDMGEKLLAYQDLNKRCAKMADLEKGRVEFAKRINKYFDTRLNVSAVSSAIGGGLIAMTVLPAAAMPMAIVSAFVGFVVGPGAFMILDHIGAKFKKGISVSERATRAAMQSMAKESPETLYNYNMSVLSKKIGALIADLSAEKNAATLYHSPRAAQMKNEFPRLKAAFDLIDLKKSRNAEQREFMIEQTPVAKRNRDVVSAPRG